MLATLLLVLALILAVVGIIAAVTQRAWTPWVTGAGIALVAWLILTLVVH